MEQNSGNLARSCRVPFLSRWSPENHMWGLSRGQAGVVIDQKSFSCCDGDGIAVCEDNPRNARLCGLSKRWNLLSHAIGAKSDLFLKKEELTGLEAFFKGYLDAILRSDRGRIINASHMPSVSARLAHELPWTLASTIGWHFEALALITRLGEGTVPFNHWNDLLTRFHGSRVILMIDGVSELWIPARLEALEAIISFASERLLPIWLFEARGTEKAAASEPRNSRSFKAAVGKRLANIKSKSTVDWLSDQARGRLGEICKLPTPKPDHDGIPGFA